MSCWEQTRDSLDRFHLSARLEMTVLPQISWRKISGSGKSVLILDGCPHNSNPDRQ